VNWVYQSEHCIEKLKVITSNFIVLKIKVALFLLILFCVQSCKVSVTMKGIDIPDDAETISVLQYRNSASLAPPDLNQTFTEDFRDFCNSQTRLDLIKRDGDINFEGEIHQYTIRPVSIQGDDIAAGNRLTIGVKTIYTNKLDESKNFELTFTKFADYTSSQDISTIRSELISDINEQLIQEIFNKAFNNW